MDKRDNSPVVKGAHVTASHVVVELDDGRNVAAPLSWYPRLAAATSDELKKIEISPFGVHWENLDEDLSVAGILAGKRSAKLRSKASEPERVDHLPLGEIREPQPENYEDAGRRNAEIDFPDLR